MVIIEILSFNGFENKKFYKVRNWDVQICKLALNIFIFLNKKSEDKHLKKFLYMSIVVVVANQVVLWYKIKWVFEKNAC